MHRLRNLSFAFAAAASGLQPAQAQVFAANYELASPAYVETGALDLSRLKFAPAFRNAEDGSGVGLSWRAGENWFGQVGVLRSPAAATPWQGSTGESLNISGGYRWGDGQSLSLEVRRGRGPGQRLGLAIGYEWPQYYVRFTYDPGVLLAPQDRVRFSAGVKF